MWNPLHVKYLFISALIVYIYDWKKFNAISNLTHTLYDMDKNCIKPSKLEYVYHYEKWKDFNLSAASST